jgi:hypothetical protein
MTPSSASAVIAEIGVFDFQLAEERNGILRHRLSSWMISIEEDKYFREAYRCNSFLRASRARLCFVEDGFFRENGWSNFREQR